MAKVLFLFFVIFTIGFNSHGSQSPSVLPFKIWKQKKIDEAQSVISEIKKENKRNTEDSEDSKSQKSQAEINLKVAKDLSANDYFVLYVTPQFKNDREALIQASKHLSSRDMAEILSAYQNALEDGGAQTAKNASQPYEETAISP